MSTVYVKDIVVEGTHGVYEHEKVTPQRFNIDVELEVDTPNAFTSDNIDDTVNYAHIRDIVIDSVQNNTFNLIERLAQELTDKISKEKYVQAVTITIEKLDIFPTGVPGIRVTQRQ